MNLQIRDPRAHALALRLARARRVSMTDAVIAALEAELRKLSVQQPLAERIGVIASDMAAMAGPHGRRLSKDEIDAMWGDEQ